MSEDSSIIDHLTAAFGTSNIYSILEVEKTATLNEINKAYKKLALKHHPDKGGDKEKFQALCLAHSILNDEEKRKVYDETGTLDDNNVGEENFDFWYNYFRNLFPKITVADIDNLQNQYVGTHEERVDVIEAYRKFSGDLNKMMQVIMFAEEGEEPRICAIIDQAIKDGTLETTNKYQKTSKDSLKKLGKSKKGNTASKKEQERKEAEEALMQAMTKRRQEATNNVTDRLAKKYGIENLNEEDPLNDEEFAKMQKKVTTNKQNQQQQKGKQKRSVDDDSTTNNKKNKKEKV